jgi:hypothetical protein
MKASSLLKNLSAYNPMQDVCQVSENSNGGKRWLFCDLIFRISGKKVFPIKFPQILNY